MNIELLAFLIGGAGFGLIYLPKYLRTQKALKSESSGTECAGCQGTAITEVAPQAYRCDGCQFQWGAGWNDMARQERRAQLDAMSAGDRRALALSELKEADARLKVAEVALEHAKNQLLPDVIHGNVSGAYGDNASRARSEAVVQASQEMGLAQKHIRNATEAADGAFEHEQVEVGVSAEAIGLDMMFDGLLMDLRGHQQAVDLARQCEAMRQAVARAAEALAAPSTDAAYR